MVRSPGVPGVVGASPPPVPSLGGASPARAAIAERGEHAECVFPGRSGFAPARPVGQAPGGAVGPPIWDTGRAMDGATYKVSVLVMEAEDIPGEWVSHCLDFDLVSQGSSPTGALDAIREAIVMVLEDDLAKGLDPRGRPRAPDRDWKLFAAVFERGHPMEDMVDRGPIGILVAEMQFEAQQLPGTLRVRECAAPERIRARAA